MAKTAVNHDKVPLFQWDELCRMYLEARRDVQVWSTLQLSIHRRLTAWLQQRLRRQLPQWEIAEAAERGFMAMFLKCEHIPSWPQAWLYCRRSAYSAARRMILGHKKLRDVPLANHVHASVEQPAKSAEEFIEFMGDFLSGLRLADLDLLIAWIRLHLSGPYTLRELAREAHLSRRTLERRMHNLRKFLAQRLPEVGYGLGDFSDFR